jgi:hypothetical protein
MDRIKRKPPLSREERARINRDNSRLSTGPKTDAGKSISKYNSLKHGLRIETLALSGEDAAELRDRLDGWINFYQPNTPGEAELIEMAVTASVQRRRSVKYLAAAQADGVRNATRRWDEDRDDEVKRLVKLLETDPAEAVAKLGRTGHGCRWLIGRWERLQALLDDPNATFAAADRDELIRLQGLAIDPDCPGAATETRLTWRIVMTLFPGIFAEERRHTPYDVREELLDAWREEQREKERARQGRPTPPDDQSWADDPARGRAWLLARIGAHLEPLRQREAVLREVYDDPEREAAADLALLPGGATGANWLRYERMHALSYHRAYSAFLKGREKAAETGQAPGAPITEGDSDGIDVTTEKPGVSVPPTPPPPPLAGTPGDQISAFADKFSRAFAPNEANRRERAASNSAGSRDNVNPPATVPAAASLVPGAPEVSAAASGPAAASDA